MTQSDSKKIMIFGIIGLAGSFMYWGAVVGLIFSILALVNYKKFTAAGLVDSKANVGKKLGTAGLIISIIMIALALILTIVFSIAAGVAVANGDVSIVY